MVRSKFRGNIMLYVTVFEKPAGSRETCFKDQYFILIFCSPSFFAKLLTTIKL